MARQQLVCWLLVAATMSNVAAAQQTSAEWLTIKEGISQRRDAYGLFRCAVHTTSQRPRGSLTDDETGMNHFRDDPVVVRGNATCTVDLQRSRLRLDSRREIPNVSFGTLLERHELRLFDGASGDLRSRGWLGRETGHNQLRPATAGQLTTANC